MPIQEARQTSRRAASISSFMRASVNAIAWFSMILRPNCSRSLAYSSAYSYAARAIPSACAPTVGREASKVCIAAWDLLFLPSRTRARRSSSLSLPPSTYSAGTRQSSRNTSAVCEARSPCFETFVPWAMPLASLIGTTKAACPRAPSSRSTDAITTCTSAMPPFVAHAFWPLITHSLVGLVELRAWCARRRRPSRRSARMRRRRPP